MKYKLTNKQRGAGLLLFILITAVLLTFLITTFLTVASRITQGTQDYIRAQRSMYGNISASKVSLASYFDADPSNDFNFNPTTPGSPETGLLSDGTYYERAVNTSGSDITVDLVAESGGSSRRLEATLSTASLANADVEVVLVIDRSLSMGTTVAPTIDRLGAVKDAGRSFLAKFDRGDGTSAAKVGLVTFATHETVVRGLTNDIAQLQDDLLAVQLPTNEVEGSTNMGQGLNAAYQMLGPDANTSKFVILLTDGEPSVEPSLDEVRQIWIDYNQSTIPSYGSTYGRDKNGNATGNGRCKNWEGHKIVQPDGTIISYWTSCDNRATRWPLDMGQILRNDPPDPVTGANQRPGKFGNIPSPNATIWAIGAPGSNKRYLDKVTNVPDQVIEITDANFYNDLQGAFDRIAAGINSQRVLYLQELKPED